jgi:catalase
MIDEAARQRLVSNVTGHLRNGVSKEVLDRAFEYWKKIDKEVGDKIKTAVGNGSA